MASGVRDWQPGTHYAVGDVAIAGERPRAPRFRCTKEGTSGSKPFWVISAHKTGESYKSGLVYSDGTCEWRPNLRVQVFVTPRRGTSNPEGQAVEESLKSLGFKEVANVRVGKYITLEVEAGSPEEARKRAKKMCEELLANPNIEEYRVGRSA